MMHGMNWPKMGQPVSIGPLGNSDSWDQNNLTWHPKPRSSALSTRSPMLPYVKQAYPIAWFRLHPAPAPPQILPPNSLNRALTWIWLDLYFELKLGFIKVDPTSIFRRRQGITRGSKRVITTGRPAKLTGKIIEKKRERNLVLNVRNANKILSPIKCIFIQS